MRKLSVEEILKQIYRTLLRILPTKPALYLIYFKGYHKILNLKNPRYYGEKIQWLKLYGGLEKLGPYVDKFEVRKYVEETIGPEHLIPLIGVYDSVEQIDFSALPSRFVMKCTNGSQAVLICRDKNQLDVEQAKRTMRKWLSDDFYKMKKETQYQYVKNRILIEEYMEDDSGELRDYKFYCFDGEPLWYAIFSGRFSQKTVDTYTISGDFLEDCKNGGKHIKVSEKPAGKLENLDRFIALARKLAAPFTEVRVDFYLTKGEIYFGELTFTDGAGSEPVFPLEKYDVAFGAKSPLGQVLKETSRECEAVCCSR